MKCPKCNYLGFATGDRCKNCGYNFSLMEGAECVPVEGDLALRLAEGDASERPSWIDEIDRGLGSEHIVPPPLPERPPVRPQNAAPWQQMSPTTPDPQSLVGRPPPATTGVAPGQTEPWLSLLPRGTEDAGDEPLIKLPAAPRPPLAVRRTPERSKLRSVAKSPTRISRELSLQFSDGAEPQKPARESVGLEASHQEVSGVAARLVAVVIDHGLLLAVDLVVVYFTLRIAALPLSEWQVLPAVPLAAFLLVLKVSYYCAFTAVWGQTIGKMAARIRVVTDTGAPVDGVRAMRRTIAGVVSTLTLGVGFVPALVGSERLALHDRFARTRVIALRSL